MGRFKYKFNILTDRKTFRDLKQDSPLRKLLETVSDELSGESKLVTGEDIGDGNGTQQEFSDTLAHPGVRPGTLSIYAVIDAEGNTERFTDRGDGTLISNKGGTGTINYTTGAYSVSFNTAPYSGADVYADYVGYFTTYKFISDALNPLYDVRFINYAWGEALDLWGQTLDVSRDSGEPDSSYRTRLLNALQNFAASLTVTAIQDKVEDVLGAGETPQVLEIWQLAPDWPITWCNDDPDKVFTTWAPWDALVDFLVVLKPGTVDDKVIGTGEDPPKYTFTGSLTPTPVKKKSITIADSSEDETFKDDGKGNLSSGEGGSGTIDYDTGAYSVTFIIPPEEGENVLADYQVLADPDEGDLDDIAKFLIEVKFAPARALIVDDSGGEYYILRKMVL